MSKQRLDNYNYMKILTNWVDKKDIFQVVKTLKSSHLTQGNLIEKFENDLKKCAKSDS